VNVRGGTKPLHTERSDGDPASRTEAQEEISRLLIEVLRRVRRRHVWVTGGQGTPFEVSGPYLVVLREIAEHPGVTVNELARAVGFPKSRVSEFMSRLAADGVIVKDCDGHDRRLVRLSLTAVGRERAVEWRAAYRASVRELLEPLTDVDLVRVEGALALLERAFSGGSGTSGTAGRVTGGVAC
jgi:DNA-binding MarR family transcriptional regulator